MIMENITLDSLTNQISLKSQLMMKELKERNLKHAEEQADDIARMIYQFRRLSESLQTEEIK